MKYNPRYQLKHLSIRVPWHDDRWNGTICNNVSSNSACLVLKNCAQKRNDKEEQRIAGKSIEGLEESQYPPCVGERATFNASFQYYKTLKHPYVKSSPSTHGHLKPTRVLFPAYSAASVPYFSMRQENAEIISAQFDLGYRPDMEPLMDWLKDKPSKEQEKKGWVQEASNQKALLNHFYEHFEPESSLVFFYAKQVPFVEEYGRVLIGVGRIKKIKDSENYLGSNKKFSAAYWEHMVHHSIREDFKDGFLLPYHDAIKYQDENPDFNPAELVVITPGDKQFEFSYASEHVSSDTSIRVLLSCTKSIEKAKELGIGKEHDHILQWIHDEIHRLEILRGDYPGMGAALCALGFPKGHFIASEIINKTEQNDNPWIKFEEELDNPGSVLSSSTVDAVTRMPKRTYERYKNKDDRSRINLLYLLSRFDLNQEQAGILFKQGERDKLIDGISDKDILENPYLIYQITRKSEYPVDLATIDLGLYTPVKGKEVFPDIHLNDPIDDRRLKALVIYQLEIAALQGHTLLPRKQIIDSIHEMALQPPSKPNSDHMEITEEIFDDHVHVTNMKNDAAAYQLSRLYKSQQIIFDKVSKSLKGDRLVLESDWRSLLDEELKKHTEGEPDDDEIRARIEKAACLEEIAESRFSVLIGPAGTGKTTVLSILASQYEIKGNGVLFLAPTGKARVRMEELSLGLGVKVSTVAQFLLKYGRFDGALQQFKFSDKYCEGKYQTVVLDESSMVTEEMMATLLDCFKGVKRFILVGDYRQLPPIGPGRPFMDIIKYLEPENINKKFPKVGKGYAELTVKRRSIGVNREDLQLAEWFSGNSLGPGDDQIINKILSGKESEYLELISWDNEEDFEKKFENSLIKELKLSGLNDSKTFNISLGSTEKKFFNSTEDRNYWKRKGIKVEAAVNKIDSWQILSPVRDKTFGVKNLNRKIHKLFRQRQVDYVSRWKGGKPPALPKPLGTEEIVYGDKIINLTNHRRKYVSPDTGLNALANGEIGVVTGQFIKGKNIKKQPSMVQIEFSTQKGYLYSFFGNEFGDENNNILELAYAMTVHKSQGSEFGVVFLIIPDPCFLLTREMLYTALTRQRDKVIVLYQGDSFKIKELSSPIHSDTLSRITNLFVAPDMKMIEFGASKKVKYLEKNLIHEASDGKLLRSKSELLIYQQLINNKIEPLYEKELIIKEVKKLPDFTILSEYSNKIYYWEHCGMMHDSEYVSRWEDKYQWYRENEILPIEEGGGKNGILITTYDTPIEVNGKQIGAFSIKQVDNFIEMIRD